MAAYYGAGATRAWLNATDSVHFQLRPTGTTQRIKVYQVIVNVAVAPTTAPVWYLTRSTAIGTNTTTLAGQPLDGADAASIATLDSVFSVAPTITAANKITVGGLATTAGGTFVWTFPIDAPIVLAASTTAGLCVVDATASGVTTANGVTCSMVWSE
jgi:hypothetical protein